MAFGKRKFQQTVKNGASEEFTLYSRNEQPNTPGWWGDTCFLVHALSQGDLSTFRAGIQQTADGNDVTLMTGAGSVTNTLYSRLEYLGYTRPEEVALPEEIQHVCGSHTITSYGNKFAADFLAAQQVQMDRFQGKREEIEQFSAAFFQMSKQHFKFPLEMLHSFRDFFSDPKNHTEIDPASKTNALLEVYSDMGIVEPLGPGQWKTTLLGALNAPFLLDIILTERGGLPVH